MQTEWEAVVDVTRDNILEIPCEAGEVVAGDRLRVRVIIEEVLVDGEEDQMRALVERLDRERAEHPEEFETIPWEQAKAEDVVNGRSVNGQAKTVDLDAEVKHAA